jgi:hypothetical protein
MCFNVAGEPTTIESNTTFEIFWFMASEKRKSLILNERIFTFFQKSHQMEKKPLVFCYDFTRVSQNIKNRTEALQFHENKVQYDRFVKKINYGI